DSLDTIATVHRVYLPGITAPEPAWRQGSDDCIVVQAHVASLLVANCHENLPHAMTLPSLRKDAARGKGERIRQTDDGLRSGARWAASCLESTGRGGRWPTARRVEGTCSQPTTTGSARDDSEVRREGIIDWGRGHFEMRLETASCPGPVYTGE